MITTITLNAAIDIRYEMTEFSVGEVNRISTVTRSAGGKGLNVARVLLQLGEKVSCTGFLGGKNGEWIVEELQKDSIDNSFVPIKGETRLCLAVSDYEKNGSTELLEPGPTISVWELASFIRKYDQILNKSQYIIASGSVPIGVPSSFYQILAEKAKEKGVYFFLDTSGEVLKQGIKGTPFFIKPNKEELCQLFQLCEPTNEKLVHSARKLSEQGIANVLVSLDKNGAILSTSEAVYQANIPTVKVVNTVGSGDSMVAGFVYALSNDLSPKEALRWGCACGIANALEQKTGFIQPHNVNSLLEKIEIVQL